MTVVVTHAVTVIHCRRVAGFRRVPTPRRSFGRVRTGGREHERAGILPLPTFRDGFSGRAQTSLETCKIQARRLSTIRRTLFRTRGTV